MKRVVVIGGSAGAVDALLAIARLLPDVFALPVVIVLHLSPTQPSLVPQLLQHVSRRPALEVEDKQPLVPGGFHVAPPNYHVLLERDGTCALSVDEPVSFSRPSIDLLFESAADAYGADAIGILLSGANEDGARGLRAIARAGGIAIVQSPDTAPYDTMPRAGLAMVPSALVVPLEELAHRLASEAAPT